MTNHFPSRVRVRVTGHQIKLIAVRVCFEMNEKNSFDYILFVGPSGVGEVCAHELLRAFDQERSESPMDYVEPRASFTGHATAVVMDNAELASAAEAFRMFKPFLIFPDGYESDLRAACALDQHPNEYHVELELE